MENFMDCSLCGAFNDEEATICHICDSALNEIEKLDVQEEKDLVIDSTDISRRRILWGSLLLVVLVFGLIFLPWALMVDILLVPKEVSNSRQEFASLKDRYFAKLSTWDGQKEEILQSMRVHRKSRVMGKPQLPFKAIPIEVLMSFLIKDLSFSEEQFNDLAVYPLKDRKLLTISLSKKEWIASVIPIVLSMEVELVSQKGQIVPNIIRLQRGKRTISRAFAWLYFGEELQALRRAEEFSGGIQDLHFHEGKVKANGERPNYLSWKYMQYSVGGTI